MSYFLLTIGMTTVACHALLKKLRLPITTIFALCPSSIEGESRQRGRPRAALFLEKKSMNVIARMLCTAKETLI